MNNQEVEPLTSERRGVSSLPKAVGDVLGMTDEEIGAALAQGSTLADMAADREVPVEDLLASLTGEKTAVIEEALAEGRITEEQAEWLLAREAALASFLMTDPFALGQTWGSGDSQPALHLDTQAR